MSNIQFDDDDDELEFSGSKKLPVAPILPVDKVVDKPDEDESNIVVKPVDKSVKSVLPVSPSLPNKPKLGLPAMPVIPAQEVSEGDSSDVLETIEVPVDKSVESFVEPPVASKPIPVDKPVKKSIRPSMIPDDAIYNEETGEYFDSKSGYLINPKNGLLVIDNIDEVEVVLPSPVQVEESRVLEGVDDSVDEVEVGIPTVSPPPVLKAKVPDIIEIEDWTDDTSSDTALGVGSEKDPEFNRKPKLGKGFTLMDRDIIMMRFLSRYRFAYPDQLARLVNAEVKDVKQRLRRLEKEGLIRAETITAGQDVWVTRKAGNNIIDLDFPEIRKGSISLITIQHTIGLANLGVELEMASGGKNILGEDEFPKYNRYPFGMYRQGESPTLVGEQTVTEREIRRGSRLFRGSKTTEDMRYLALAAEADESAPELLEGNEGLFVVYGTGKDGEHVPDLVVARERDEYGKPQHIAIELELTPKNSSEWARIFRWYKDHGFMYSKIYYYTHKRSLADNLKRVADSVGIGDRVVIKKYIPQNNRGPFWG